MRSSCPALSLRGSQQLVAAAQAVHRATAHSSVPRPSTSRPRSSELGERIHQLRELDAPCIASERRARRTASVRRWWERAKLRAAWSPFRGDQAGFVAPSPTPRHALGHFRAKAEQRSRRLRSSVAVSLLLCVVLKSLSGSAQHRERSKLARSAFRLRERGEQRRTVGTAERLVHACSRAFLALVDDRVTLRGLRERNRCSQCTLEPPQPL